jgi:YVTN family beta-propeller protein
VRPLGLVPAALLLALGLSAAARGGQDAAGPAPALSDRAVEQGVAVELSISPLPLAAGGGSGAAPLAANRDTPPRSLREGQDVVFRFRVSDANTGQPLGGLSPAAWLDLPAAAEVGVPGCAARIKELAGGSLFAKSELDLASFYVLALDEDASINVIDPLFSFGGSKLFTSIPLLSPGEDWALTADGQLLFVSEPEADRLALIDTATWKVAAQIAPGRHPTRVALQPDGARLWAVVAADDGSDVAVIDAREARLLARIATGKGPHDLAVSADSSTVFVTNAGDGTVSVLDARRLVKVADVRTGTWPTAIAYSSLAGAAYVTDERDGSVVAVDGRRRAVVARLPVRPGAATIRFAPGGRLGFVLNPRQDLVQVIDAGVNRVVTTGTVRQRPDQVVFSDQLAYIRHRGSDSVLMVPLSSLGQEGHPLEAADFTGGQQPFGRGLRPSLADGIAPAPGGSAVLVANPADRTIYYYVEGMAAPTGSFHNYGREPRAVLVVDRGLRERRRPGTYETTARLPGAGRYRIPFFLDAPRVVHCFEMEVLPDPELAAARLRSAPVQVEPLAAERRVQAGSTVRLRFRLTDPASGSPATGVGDLVMMAYTVSGGWQTRKLAREVGNGIYEAEFVPPGAGAYAVVVECLSRRLPFHLSPRLLLEATPAPTAPAASRRGSKPDL